MRFRLFQFAIVLLAGIASAQDDPWKGDPIDPDRLAEQRRELEKSLTPPGKDASDDDKAWFAARSRRVSLLDDLERAIRSLRAIPAADESDAAKARAEQRVATLRDRADEPLPRIEAAADIEPLEDAARKAAAADEEARAELERLRSFALRFEKGLQNAATRESELRKSVDEGEQAKPGTVLAYRRGNAQLELRLLETFSRASGEVRKRIDAAIAAAQAARDLTKLTSERASKRLDAARAAVQSLVARQAESLRAEAKRLREEAAPAEPDPLRRAILLLRARERLRRAEIAEDAKRGTELKARIQQKKEQNAHYEFQIAQVERKVESRRPMVASTAELLHSTLMSAKGDRRALEETTRRNLDLIDEVLNELGDVQDIVWSLEKPVEQLPEWKELAEHIPAERREEAMRTFSAAIRNGQSGLLDAVRARAASLKAAYDWLKEIDSLHTAQANSLDRLEALISGHLYWVQTDPRIGFALFLGAWEDLGRLQELYAEPEFVEELGAARSERPGALVGSALVLVVLLVGVTYAARRIRTHPMHRPRQGEHLRSGLRDGARTLGHAAAPSLVLLLAAASIGRLELPLRLTFPLEAGFRVVAFLLFVQRLTWGLLGKRGFLIAHFGVRQEVGEQILRSVRLYTFAGMLLWLPHRLLLEAHVDVDDLRRIFGTAFRWCELASVALLLPRRRPVAQAFISGNETGLRVLGVLNPILFGILLVLALMDYLGYRYGAIFFTERVMVTTVAIVALRALYAGLDQISERVTQRVRERAFREQGGTAAWEDSSLVTRQLTRLITTGFVVAAAVVLLQAWNTGGAGGAWLTSWKLAEFSDGIVLTAADVGSALLFLVGAHFLSSNIAGIFELLVFPIFGKVHRGTRFVVLALSRYLILLIGYGSALVAVHFSVANLGWLLAAASVGLGFGLQEIVANFVSGLILLVEQPVRVGDIITVGDSGGTVERITIRSTVVTNWDQQQIIIPNKAFITQNLTNWTRNNNFTRRRIPLNVAYGSDVEKVFAILEDTVKAVENVRSYPPPRIWFDGFGESGLEFVIWIYVDIDNGLATMTDVRRKLLLRLEKEGIRIPFPQRDVHVHRDAVEDLQGAAGTLEEPPREAEPGAEAGS